MSVTFVGGRAWALGSADCLSGSGRCDAIEYSADGGSSWRSAPAPRANVPGESSASCASPCVSGLRFATARVGYAYGPDSLFMTTDGGASWQRQPGSAAALETLDGNVIRVVNRARGCPPGCLYSVLTAPVGSTSWRPVTLPGAQSQGDGVLLARTGSHAYLQSYGNPAGGSNDAMSVLWSSADDGAHWTRRGEPCPQATSGEVDSVLLSAAPDGAVGVLCRARRSGATSVAISTDGGAQFGELSRTALGSAQVSAFALGSAGLVIVSSDDAYRSSDGGAHFVRLDADAGSSPGQLGYAGFAGSSVVHGLTEDGRRVAVSTDGGRTWVTHPFV